MLMRHAHEYEAKPRGGLAKRIVAVLASVAMLSGMGYATSAALAEDTPATVETTTDQSATTANESTDGKNAADGTDADNAGDAATGTAGTESDTNTGADAGVNTANAANAGDAASSDANSQTDTTTAQSNPQTVNAEQNSPSVVADDTGSDCIYAGTNALQRVCWLDMSKFDSETAKAGQKMTVNLGGGLTMSFTAHYSGERTVVASKVPTWDNRAAHPGEAGHHAIFGVEGYSDFPSGSKPALYQNNGYGNGSKIQLSDITIAKDRQKVDNLQYSFVMADAESTNKDEQMVYTSSSAITKLGSYPTSDSNYRFCRPKSSNDGTTMTCTGEYGDGVPQGIRLYTTSAPAWVSIEMKNSGPGSRQGAAFGVIFSQAVAKITVNGLASGDANTTFKAGVSNDETESLESDSISSHTTAESGTLPILASADVSKTVRFYLEGNPGNWSKYDVTFEGTDNGTVVPDLDIKTDGNGLHYVDMTVAADHTVQGYFTVTAKPDPLGVPEHHKTIAKKPGANDTYTLNLDVTGKQSSTSQTVSQPVDIALVLDVSGSMDEAMGGTTKLAALKKAAKEFLTNTANKNAAIADNSNKIRVSLVKFASNKRDTTGNNTYYDPFYRKWLNHTQIVSNLTDDMNTLSASVDALRAGGATRADYGLEKANAVLANARANAKKVVVFFTDGEPNSESGFDDGVADAAVKNARTLKDSGTTIYSVGVFSKADPSDTSGNFNAYMNAVSSNYPNATTYKNLGTRVDGGNYYMIASNSEGLSKVFEDIQQTITTTNGYTGVTIQDTLSKYADFADDKPEKNAKVVTNDADVTEQWNIKVDGKTITASPKSSEPLLNGVTYTLQFDIKPTQEAYDDYVANKNAGKDGYNGVTGSDGSDAAGNDTSAGKPGFYTNDSACLAYSGDGETHACDTLYAEQPVDQVKTGAITVQKKWVDADGKVSSEGNPESVTFTLQIDGTDSGREATATADTAWKASFENLAPGHTYKVVEKAVEGYETSYESQEVKITANELWEAKRDANEADNVREWPVAVTNTHKKSTLAEGSIKVSKSISGRKWKDGDSFKFTIAGSDPTQNAPLPNPDSVAIGTKTENHEASFGEIEYKTAGTYTYTVKETKPIAAIAGLHYSQAEYTVTVKVPTDMGTPTVSIKRVTDDNGKPGDNQSANVAKFTNTYVAVSALPLTGGTTDRQWLLVGGSIGGLAVLLVGAAGIWNSKKRLV